MRSFSFLFYVRARLCLRTCCCLLSTTSRCTERMLLLCICRCSGIRKCVHLLQNVEAKQGHAESQQRPRILLQTPACPEETEPIAVYNMNMAGYPNEQRQSRSSLLNKRHIPSCFYPIAPCRAIGGSLADQSSLLL